MGQEQNDQQNFRWPITEEPQVLTVGLEAVLEIHDLFIRHRCEWMAKPFCSYSLMMIWEFYASYVATIKKKALSKAKELEKPSLLTTLVREIPIGLSEETIRRVLKGINFQQPAPTAEFDHKMKNVRDQNVTLRVILA